MSDKDMNGTRNTKYYFFGLVILFGLACQRRSNTLLGTTFYCVDLNNRAVVEAFVSDGQDSTKSDINGKAVLSRKTFYKLSARKKGYEFWGPFEVKLPSEGAATIILTFKRNQGLIIKVSYEDTSGNSINPPPSSEVLLNKESKGRTDENGERSIELAEGIEQITLEVKQAQGYDKTNPQSKNPRNLSLVDADFNVAQEFKFKQVKRKEDVQPPPKPARLAVYSTSLYSVEGLPGGEEELHKHLFKEIDSTRPQITVKERGGASWKISLQLKPEVCDSVYINFSAGIYIYYRKGNDGKYSNILTSDLISVH